MHQFTPANLRRRGVLCSHYIVSILEERVKMSEAFEVGDDNSDSSLAGSVDVQSGGGGHPVHDTSWQPRPFPM